MIWNQECIWSLSLFAGLRQDDYHEPIRGSGVFDFFIITENLKMGCSSYFNDVCYVGAKKEAETGPNFFV